MFSCNKMCCYKYLWWLYSHQLLSPPPPPPVVAISSFTLPPHHHIYALVSSSCMVNAEGQRESTNRQKIFGPKDVCKKEHNLKSHLLLGHRFSLVCDLDSEYHIFSLGWYSSSIVAWQLALPFFCEKATHRSEIRNERNLIQGLQPLCTRITILF